MADPASDIPPHVAETIRAIALLHAEHHRKSTFPERVADRATASIGRPRFLLLACASASAWVICNLAIKASGGSPPDPPPFAWMELAFTIVAFFIAVLILTSQRRADRFANLREQMTLESTLLTEQKTRKIIELIEELRRDSPEIQDRFDAEAAQMTEKADPHVVLSVIEETTQEVILATARDGGTARNE